MGYGTTSNTAAFALNSESLSCANSDSIAPVDMPHADALLSHISSLAYSHALQHIKCEGTETARCAELESVLASLKKSFTLTREQLAYLRHAFELERKRKQTYIAERFYELEKNVVELAKARIKEESAKNSDATALQAISRLKQMLQLADENVAEQIERKANRLTENAFLIAIKKLALTRRKLAVDVPPLGYDDVQTIARQFEDFEISPVLLDRATDLYDRVLAP